MLKHILFLRPVDIKDLEKIILHSPYGAGVDFSDSKIQFGRLEIQYIYEDNQLVNKSPPPRPLIKGLECDVSRDIDAETFYSIVEHIGTIQISMCRFWRI